MRDRVDRGGGGGGLERGEAGGGGGGASAEQVRLTLRALLRRRRTRSAVRVHGQRTGRAQGYLLRAAVHTCVSCTRLPNALARLSVWPRPSLQNLDPSWPYPELPHSDGSWTDD